MNMTAAINRRASFELPDNENDHMSKVTIHGAGSIGCFVGGIWASVGLDVTLIGRAYVGDAIKEQGIRLTDYAGYEEKLSARDIKFSTEPNALEGADIIGLAVKSTGTAAAAAEIDRHAKTGAIVVSLQNGISNVATLRGLLPKQTVLAGMVPFNVAALKSGHWHKGTQGDLVAQSHQALAPIVQATRGSPAALTLAPNMTAVAWGKLLVNLNNALNALSGVTLLEELSDRNFRLILAASIREALAILAAAGIKPAKATAFPPKWLPAFVSAPDFFFNTIGLKLQKIDDRARSSMADDFALGRATEIDFLNGEVVNLAKKMQMDAPVNEAIVALVKQVEGSKPRAWTGEDLRRKILCY